MGNGSVTQHHLTQGSPLSTPGVNHKSHAWHEQPSCIFAVAHQATAQDRPILILKIASSAIIVAIATRCSRFVHSILKATK
eukprot:scaffold218686_cov41-Tisochrysis_lutea.AAC.1